MSRNITKTLAVLSICFFVSACVEPIVMDPMEEMPVVVKCVLARSIIGPDDPDYVVPVQSLELFYAKRLSEDQYVNISKAAVKVSGGGQAYDFTWNGTNWTCEFLPEYGIRYELAITLEDGRTISAKTGFPKEMSISGQPVYTGISRHSHAKYYRVKGCDDDAFIWITAAKGRENEISHFCSNHPGTDNSNVIDGIWEDLPIAGSLRNDFNSILDDPFEDADRQYWLQFGRLCLGLPIHKDYLRIHYQADFDNGTSTPLIQNKLTNRTELCTDGFILAADLIETYTPPEWIGGEGTRLPIRINFLSKEYDLYLNNVVKAGLHSDELTTMYSMDLNYTNIDGGIGIFGSSYYKDYVN